MLDDIRRKAVTAIGDRSHTRSLRRTPPNRQAVFLTMPLAWLLSLPLLESERLLGGHWKIRPAAGVLGPLRVHGAKTELTLAGGPKVRIPPPPAGSPVRT